MDIYFKHLRKAHRAKVNSPRQAAIWLMGRYVGLIADQTQSGIELAQVEGHLSGEKEQEKLQMYPELRRHPALLISQFQVEGGCEDSCATHKTQHNSLVKPVPEVMFALLRLERCGGNNSANTFELKDFLFAPILITASH